MATKQQIAALLRSIADTMVEEVLEPATGIDARVLQTLIEGTTTGAVDAGKAPKSRRTTAYARAYKRAFKRVSAKHKKQNGEWKKGGFKRAVKEAHKEAGGKKK